MPGLRITLHFFYFYIVIRTGLMHSLIIFASGTGTNANAIIEYFNANRQAKVSLIVSNNPNAGVLKIAAREAIPTKVVNRESFKGPAFISELQQYNPSLIVLAGFLWKIPGEMVRAFPGRIINIHPALLPGYGGKGMYGHHVHHAVIEAREKESGITVHFVNEHYDEGDVILQARCKVQHGDTAEQLAARIHRLEHFYFPRAIEFLLKDTI
jgi:phosphoribosylglycinamide formyltransferase 1